MRLKEVPTPFTVHIWNRFLHIKNNENRLYFCCFMKGSPMFFGDFLWFRAVALSAAVKHSQEYFFWKECYSMIRDTHSWSRISSVKKTCELRQLFCGHFCCDCEIRYYIKRIVWEVIKYRSCLRHDVFTMQSTFRQNRYSVNIMIKLLSSKRPFRLGC